MNKVNNFYLTQPLGIEEKHVNDNISYYIEINNVSYILKTGVNIIGRDENCDIKVYDGSLSRQHAMIEVTPEGSVFIQDLGSINKTFRNRCELRKNVMYELINGNELKFGLTSAKFIESVNSPEFIDGKESDGNFSSQTSDLFIDGCNDNKSSSLEENANDMSTINKNTNLNFSEFYEKENYKDVNNDEQLDDTEIFEENSTLNEKISETMNKKQFKEIEKYITSTPSNTKSRKSDQVIISIGKKKSDMEIILDDLMLNTEVGYFNDSESPLIDKKPQENIPNSILNELFYNSKIIKSTNQIEKPIKSNSIDIFRNFSSEKEGDVLSETDSEDNDENWLENRNQNNLILSNSEQELCAIDFTKVSHKKKLGVENSNQINLKDQLTNSNDNQFGNEITNLEPGSINQLNEQEKSQEKDKIDERNDKNLILSESNVDIITIDGPIAKGGVKEFDNETINNLTQIIHDCSHIDVYTQNVDNIDYLPTQKLDTDDQIISTQIINETGSNQKNRFSLPIYSQIATQSLPDSPQSTKPHNESQLLSINDDPAAPMLSNNSIMNQQQLNITNQSKYRKTSTQKKFEKKIVDKIFNKKSTKKSLNRKISNSVDDENQSINSVAINKIDNFNRKLMNNRNDIFEFECGIDDLMENPIVVLGKKISLNISSKPQDKIKKPLKERNFESTSKINGKNSKNFNFRQTLTSQNAVLNSVANLSGQGNMTRVTEQNPINDEIPIELVNGKNKSKNSKNAKGSNENAVGINNDLGGGINRGNVETNKEENKIEDISEQAAESLISNSEIKQNHRKTTKKSRKPRKSRKSLGTNDNKLLVKQDKPLSSSDLIPDNVTIETDSLTNKKKRGRPRKSNSNSKISRSKFPKTSENQTETEDKENNSINIDKQTIKRKFSSDPSQNDSKELKKIKTRKSIKDSIVEKIVVIDESQCLAVMFTGLNDPKFEKIINMLGGETVDDINQADCLVTDKIRRTVKFLCCLARGVPIVTPDWLISCQRAKRFVDTQPFIVKKNGASFKINLVTSIKLACNYQQTTGGIMAYYRCIVYVAGETQPNSSQLEQIISCAGGKMLLIQDVDFYEHLNDVESKHICVADPEVMKTVNPDLLDRFRALKEKNIDILSVEFILTMIMEQNWTSPQNYRLDFVN